MQKTIKNILLFVLFVTCITNQQICAQSGKDGNKVIGALNTLINEYTYLTANATSGSFSIAVNNSSLNTNGLFSANLTAGDLVMIIQMQGATIDTVVAASTWGNITNYNTCGNYQFLEVSNVPNINTIEFNCPLQYDFSAAGKTQVVRVPRYNSLTVSAGASATSLAWNGTIGGICAAEISGNTIIDGKVESDYNGFRGGVAFNNSVYGLVSPNYSSTNAAHGAAKGESIVGFTAEYNTMGGAYSRGAPANGGGGGGNHNCGGGGGANAGNIAIYNGLGIPDVSTPAWVNAWNQEQAGFATNNTSGGGKGGYSYCDQDQNALVTGPNNAAWGGDRRKNLGGIGGRPLDYSTGKIFMGGGGGAGDGNNGCSTNGGSGGGIVFLLSYGTVSGAGNISANGDSSATTRYDGGTVYYGIDAPGGGGGGGTIIIQSTGAVAGVSLSANGGRGGNQIMIGTDDDLDGIRADEAEGPGGGGGGGYIAISSGAPATSVLGGANGVTNSPLVTEFIPNGATAGAPGIVTVPPIYTYVLNVKDTIVCFNQPAVLTAQVNTTDPIKPIITWYDAIGGNIIAQGDTVTTVPLTKDTILYAKICYGTSITTGSIIQPVNVTVTLPPTINATPTSIVCFNDNNGQISSVVNGSYPGYNFLWSNGATTSSLSALAAGTYSVVVTDAKGCVDSLQNIIITEPSELITSLTMSTPAPCAVSANVDVSVSASGATTPYSYSWSGSLSSETTSAIIGIPVGSYSVIVTDNVGCDDTLTFNVAPQPAPLQMNITSQPILCFGDLTGMADPGISGGTSPYTYSWDNGSTDQALSNVGAGTYNVTITDANNCSVDTFFILTQPSELLQTSIGTNVDCFGNNNGSITSTPSGGAGSYTYSWDNGSTDNNLTGLSPATYALTITDLNGCTVDTFITITEPPPLTATPTSTNATCGNLDGAAGVTLVGGTTPYTYSWSNSNTNSSVSNIGAGNYTVNISDQNGCTLTETFIITDNGNVTASITSFTPVSCYQGSDGSATALGSGGTGTYSYSWLVINGTAQTATALSNGTYTVVVSDGNNCSATQTVSITEPTQLNPLASSVQATCNLTNGSASVLISGGTGPYTYVWSNTGETTTSISNIPIGTYSVTVTDNNGCDTTASISVTQPPLVGVQISSFTDTKCALDNGMATAEAFSGTSPYTYTWLSMGVTQPVISGLAPGTYSVVTVDANNCKDTIDVTIAPSVLPDPTFTSIVADTCGTSCFSSIANSANLNYSWTAQNSSGTSSSLDFCVTESGPYVIDLVVTDQDGCTATFSDTLVANVLVKPQALVTANETVVSILSPRVQFYNVSLNANTWLWQFQPTGDTSTTLNPIITYDSPGEYCTMLYTANNSCLDTTEICIEVKPEFTFYAPNTFTPNGDGIDDVWTPKGINIDESTYELLVFDRWGAQIWKTNSWGEGWNGKANGGLDIAQIDTYVWMVRFRDLVENAEHRYIGHVNLIK